MPFIVDFYVFIEVFFSVSTSNNYDSSEESDDTFPVWLSACQWCAILGLISMTVSFLIQIVCLLNSCSESQTLRVTSLITIGITGDSFVMQYFLIQSM